MMNIEVIIVGGGLSGLYAARLLEKAGINYLLLEGRERMGGVSCRRIPLRLI
ncbi:TPA: NAD(P)-binding protein [Klebsiella pneumoniae]|uniref:NAD(P)-binding protein n=2 Tax=Klebsiella pneumoniae TaxID=573 RepID=UPI000E2D72D7|nr:NAD(P)-binding protein [Klebsiella pneumoniae]SYS26109.1 ribulose-1,5-biphosphate synthetase [Klebsiella pneumoniae]VVK43121.1 ribulose-1,5-biphosphate synthetase [Klebsiella pneumoniae]